MEGAEHYTQHTFVIIQAKNKPTILAENFDIYETRDADSQYVHGISDGIGKSLGRSGNLGSGKSCTSGTVTVGKWGSSGSGISCNKSGSSGLGSSGKSGSSGLGRSGKSMSRRFLASATMWLLLLIDVSVMISNGRTNAGYLCGSIVITLIDG